MSIPEKTFKFAVALSAVILLTITLHGQNHFSDARFDSLYARAMSCLPADMRTSRNCLETLKAAGEPLSDIQKAKLGYLQMKINDAVKTSTGNLSNSSFTSPGPLKLRDSLKFYARRYLERSMPDMAIPLLMKALEVLPGDSRDFDYARIELCEAYRQKQEYQKGIELLETLIYRPVPMSEKNRVYAFSRLAAIYNESGKPSDSYTDSVFKYSLLCQELSKRTGDKPGLGASQNELSFQYMCKKDYDKALELSQEAVSNFLSVGMPFHAMNALINQSNIYLGKRDYKASLRSLEKVCSLSPVWENRNLYVRIYGQYAAVYKATGDYRAAYEFLSLCLGLQVEFFKDRMNSQIVEQSARYDLFIKEQKIREAQKKNEFSHRQIILLIILTISLALAFAISFFYFRLSRKEAMRQKLIDAVLETEMNERRRIARDLHDGLGPLLSAINHYFQAFLDAKPESKDAIQARLQTVISEAIDEVSRISHNISPHILEKHGLITALNNLMAPLTANGRYEVIFTSMLEERVDPKTELTVYRCIAELLNNTLKHAEATIITVDIRHAGNHLHIRYSDNGKGFDPTPGKRTGMGISNITNRVESSGGTVSMDSSPDAGISVCITIPI
jgi:signal transduction histidine kinase